MRGLADLWEDVSTSFWFVPAAIALALAVLAVVLADVDHSHQDIPELAPWLLGGTADAARQILATIAGSLITAISVFFSITMVALQQASTQYSPRVLHLFSRDRGVQVILGAYVGTFVYSLLVLRTVRSEYASYTRFVPALSVAAAIFLAVVCVALLIYFIQSMSQLLQVSEIIFRLHRDLTGQIEALYPAPYAPEAKSPPAESLAAEVRGSAETMPVLAERTGYVRSISVRRLRAVRADWVHAFPRVGDFVACGQAIGEVGGVRGSRDEVSRRVTQAIAMGRQRSVKQDPLYAMRQLVDIALKALSPGINDPTTAQHALLYLGDGLRRLSRRALPTSLRRAGEGRPVVLLAQPPWEEFVTLCFDQIRHASDSHGLVLTTLVDALALVGDGLPDASRADALRAQLAAIRERLGSASFGLRERQLLEEAIDRCERVLPH